MAIDSTPNTMGCRFTDPTMGLDHLYPCSQQAHPKWFQQDRGASNSVELNRFPGWAILMSCPFLPQLTSANHALHSSDLFFTTPFYQSPDSGPGGGYRWKGGQNKFMRIRMRIRMRRRSCVIATITMSVIAIVVVVVVAVIISSIIVSSLLITVLVIYLLILLWLLLLFIVLSILMSMYTCSLLCSWNSTAEPMMIRNKGCLKSNNYWGLAEILW